MGAIASGGILLLNDDVVAMTGVSRADIDAVARREARELARRERVYRGERPLPELRGRTVVLVDDGLATGASMRAAIAGVRRAGAARVVVAVPIASRETCARLAEEADEVVCVVTPEPFQAVGLGYDDFSEVGDSDVRALLP